MEAYDDYKPVLQIVHITDLHVKHMSANAAHPLAAGKWRALHRTVRDYIERLDIAGWDEGTQGHYPRAPESFRRFLADWRQRDPEWSDVPVWLVDTGDRTAFGDQDSIDAGHRFLGMWSGALGGCPVRTLYGNHDAWPGTLPALGVTDIASQRQRVAAVPDWEPGAWLSKPLRAPIGGRNGSIELFAFDTVCWSAYRNTRAVGAIDDETFERFMAISRTASAAEQQGLRILAMHHPLAFPWKRAEVRALGAVPAMRLLDDDKHARWLRNDANDPYGTGPLVHLVLSGHTHLRHPGDGMPLDVTDVKQGALAAWQLQLVGGPLMLNKNLKAASSLSDSTTFAMLSRAKWDFAPASVDSRSCQCEILRFLASPVEDGSVVMIRHPIYSHDSGATYEEDDPDCVRLYYATP